MLFGHTVTTAQLKARMAVRGNRKAVTSPSQNEKRLRDEIMAAHSVDAEYLRDLDALTKRISEDMTRKLLHEPEGDTIGVSAFYQPGRVYDQVVVNFIKKDRSVTPLDVLYFVKRSTGEIFGPKSPTAPNPKWYFGTLKTQNAWDWSDTHAVPTDLEKAGVREARRYGEFVHYEAVSSAPATTRAPVSQQKRAARPRPRKTAGV